MRASVKSRWTVVAAAGLLMSVRSAALQELLIAEDEVANALSSGAQLPTAPAAPAIPAEYPRLMLGQSRPRQEKLNWWDRFQTADGWFAASARFAVAASVVGAVIFTGAALAFGPSATSVEPVLIESTVDQPTLDAPEYVAPPSLPELAPSEPITDAPIDQAPTGTPPAPAGLTGPPQPPSEEPSTAPANDPPSDSVEPASETDAAPADLGAPAPPEDGEPASAPTDLRGGME